MGVVGGLALALLAGLSASTQTSAGVATGPPRGSLPLCSVLEAIGPGEVARVVVSGVYQVAYEAQVLFDPHEPRCRRDVQPVTWVEFAAAAHGSDDLSDLLDTSRRVMVIFEGRLHGPGRILPDDPALPFAAAFANRTRNRR